MIVIIAACNTTRRTTTTSTTTTTNDTPVNPFPFGKPADGINAPGAPELTALQMRYQDVTMDKLNEGYVIYTQGACIKCHNAQSIYMLNEEKWKGILDDMALRARISDAEKDAVNKYVLAMKSTQPK